MSEKCGACPKARGGMIPCDSNSAREPSEGSPVSRAAGKGDAMECHLSLEEQPGADDRGVIERGLVDHAAACGVAPRNHRTMTVLVRNGQGRVLGGLVGTTVWGWLQVGQLWVADEIRGAGYGTALMRAGEAEALHRGCHHALLDTFDFQARGFYERLGYQVFGALRDFPRAHTRFFMQKELHVASSG